MAKKAIIKHAIFGGSYAPHAAPIFVHIVGVLAVSTGEIGNANTPFVHIAFDELYTSYEKITELFFTLASRSTDSAIFVYPRDENEKQVIGKLKESKHAFFDVSRIKEETAIDFTNQIQLELREPNVILYLAHPDEATVRLSTREGAVVELEETKRAILNLLEDTRESQDKITAQAEDLAKALEDARAFARTAEEERATYHQLVASIGEGVIVLDREGKVRIINDVTLRMTGATREALIGKSPVEALQLRDREKKELSREFLDSIINAEKTIVLPVLTTTRKDGATLYASSIAAPIINEQTKERNGVIITFRDISEELALDEARGNFISTASHQLRTPLTTMRWFIEMLNNGDAGTLNESQEQYLMQISQSVDRMVNLVNFLLRTARVETSRVRIAPKPIHIRSIIDQCIAELKPRLLNKHQTVTFLGDELPEIALDPDYTLEVFTNLLMNAQLYGAPNDTIEIRFAKNGDFAEVHITDHGIGISREERKRVFEKFFRSGKAIVASPDGSGLGLSFVKTLVDNWGGKIWFESEEGKGATFSVSVPLSGMKTREGEVTLTE